MRRGWTLVELLMVVLIIGIILSIAYPRLTGLIDTNRENATQADLEALRIALRRYYMEHMTYPTSTSQFIPRYFPPDPLGGKNEDGSPRPRAYTKLRRSVSLSLPDNLANLVIYAACTETIGQRGDYGGWVYITNETADLFGNIYINATSLGLNGIPYSAW
jgi:prepilin-type N-terminal cleavage/methylation domain-containing protein